MSFHECGGNIGDDVHIPLPFWVKEIGGKNPDIFFTDGAGQRNPECLSWGIDKERVLRGRTAVEVFQSYKYKAFVHLLFRCSRINVRKCLALNLLKCLIAFFFQCKYFKLMPATRGQHLLGHCLELDPLYKLSFPFTDNSVKFTHLCL